MQFLLPTLLATSLLTGGLSLTSTSLADENEHHRGMHHGMHDDDRHHGEGYHHGRGKHGCDYHKPWMEGLTDEQRKKIDGLRAEYKKKKYALKDKIGDAKVELAKEIGKDAPKQKNIDKKIDAILALKREKMRIKAAHKIEVRAVLNKQQREKFDEYMIKKAKYHRKGKGYRHHQ